MIWENCCFGERCCHMARLIYPDHEERAAERGKVSPILSHASYHTRRYLPLSL